MSATTHHTLRRRRAKRRRTTPSQLCHRCGGSGGTDASPCERCRGSGFVRGPDITPVPVDRARGARMELVCHAMAAVDTSMNDATRTCEASLEGRRRGARFLLLLLPHQGVQEPGQGSEYPRAPGTFPTVPTDPERLPARRNGSYTELEVDAGLTALVVCSGNSRRAEGLLAESGYRRVPDRTLHDWKSKIHARRRCPTSASLRRGPCVSEQPCASRMRQSASSTRHENKSKAREEQDMVELEHTSLASLPNLIRGGRESLRQVGPGGVPSPQRPRIPI